MNVNTMKTKSRTCQTSITIRSFGTMNFYCSDNKMCTIFHWDLEECTSSTKMLDSFAEADNSHKMSNLSFLENNILEYCLQHF